MPETSENWLVLYTVAFTLPARPMKFIRYCLTLWISKLPAGSFEIHWVKQYFVNVVLFWIKDLQTSEMTAKLEKSMYVRPVNIFLIFASGVHIQIKIRDAPGCDMVSEAFGTPS